VRFIADRADVAKKAASKPMAHRAAVAVFDTHLKELESRLAAGGPFLFGETPCHTDFAAWHTYWFHRVVGELPAPAGFPAVAAWYRRMGEFGHGRHEEISGAEAFAAVSESAPRAVPQAMRDDPRIGQTVTVQPADYALDATSGELVGADERRWILARDSDFGRVHVHFPCEGFVLG
jgi:hypothetical protein